MKKTKLYISIVLFVFSNQLLAQVIETAGVINKTAPESNQNVSYEYWGGTAVHLYGNYNATPPSGNYMHAKIDATVLTEAPIGAPFTTTQFENQTINTSLSVGYTPGNHGVSQTGASTYSIPIQLPPGTNGVVPSLSINYNSQAGDGILGWGWEIGGLSAITRVPQTVYHDGEIKGVQLSIEDIYSLDGNRLIKPGSNDGYGESGCIYYTELETFSKITSFGDHEGNGPEYFIVKTKDGRTVEYGNSSDSKFLSEDKDYDGEPDAVIAYRINKITDQHGNYIEYKYLNSGRQSKISQILFTGNDAEGLAPYNKIQFYYQERDDDNETFIVGSSIKSKALLSKITVIADGSQFKRYEFNYGESIHTFLKSVTEFGSNGEQLNPTIFKYGDEAPERFTIDEFDAIAGEENIGIFPGDYNGDGITDLMTVKFNTYQVEEPSQECLDAFAPGGDIGSHPTCLQAWLQGSYPGPPTVANCQCYSNSVDPVYGPNPTQTVTYTDVTLKLYLKNGPTGNFVFTDQEVVTSEAGELIPYVSSSTSPLLLSHSGVKDRLVLAGSAIPSGPIGNISSLLVVGYYGSSLGSSEYAVTTDSEGEAIYPNITEESNNYFFQGDFMGKGYPELITLIAGPDGLKAYMGTNFRPIAMSPFNVQFLMEAEHTAVIDFNGDGKMDILGTRDDHTFIFTFTGSSSEPFCQFIYSRNYPGAYHDFILPGDFNGDGKTDLLEHSIGNDAWSVAYSTGKDFVIEPFYFYLPPDISSSSWEKLKIGDYNGDGYADILHSHSVQNNEDRVHIFYSTGYGFERRSQVRSFLNSSPMYSGDFNGDGRTDELQRFHYAYPFEIMFFSEDSKNLWLTDIRNGIGYKTNFDYSWLTKGSGIYSLSAGNSVPSTLNLTAAIHVVSQSSSSDGVGGMQAPTNYFYNEAKRHKNGKGFLGFSEVTATNYHLNRKTVSTFELEPDFFYRRLSTKVITTIAGEAINDLSISYGNPGTTDLGDHRYWYAPSSKTSTDHITGFSSSQNFNYDDYGNVEHLVRVNGPESTTIDRTYIGLQGWHADNRLFTENVSISRAGDEHTSTKNYYYTNEGAIYAEGNDLGTDKEIVTFYEHDGFGNVTKRSTGIQGPVWRINEYEYDPKGRFVTKAINPLNQESEFAYDNRWGTVTQLTDIQGQTQTSNYDGFGRILSSTDPLGIVHSMTYNWDLGGEPNAIFTIEKQAYGEPSSKVWFDVFNRELRKDLDGLDQTVSVSKTYNSLGQIAETSGPHNSGQGVVTTFNYDNKFRLDNTTNITGTTSYDYDNSTGYYKTTITTPVEETFTVVDPSGKIKISKDDGGVISFNYDACGKVKGSSYDGNTVSSIYDDWGYRISLTDPNSGTSGYEHNAFGELINQTVNGYEFVMEYDDLGRLTSRTGPQLTYEPDGSVSVDQSGSPVTQTGVTSYQYFNSGNGLNQLKRITAPNGTKKEFTYDEHGRPITQSRTIEGTTHTHSLTYNNNGRLATKTYPSGLTLNYTYNSEGFLIGINGQGEQIFTANSANEYGALTNYTLGNGKTTERQYDALGRPQDIYTEDIIELMHQWDLTSGNLEWREDAVAGVNSTLMAEEFEYDYADRLERVEVNGATDFPALTASYEGNGNIMTKSDAGDYQYYQDRPNAVKSISNQYYNISYENISQEQQEIIYTTQQRRVASITEGNYRALFTYGPDNQRIKMVLQQKNTSSVFETMSTRYYFGDYEELHFPDGHYYGINYISGGDGLCAIYVTENGEPIADGDFYYVYKDHIGSILTLTNENGDPDWRQSFDAWGRYRDPETWETLNSDPSEGGVFANEDIDMPEWFNRGYTGHEHLRHFDLINMNGRLYDPIPGRMLSADNHIQAPYNTQSYNRYSYVWNNPMKYVDPSGEFLIKYLVDAYNANSWDPYNFANGGWKDMTIVAGYSNGSAFFSFSPNSSTPAMSINYNISSNSLYASQQPGKQQYVGPYTPPPINWTSVHRASYYDNIKDKVAGYWKSPFGSTDAESLYLMGMGISVERVEGLLKKFQLKNYQIRAAQVNGSFDAIDKIIKNTDRYLKYVDWVGNALDKYGKVVPVIQGIEAYRQDDINAFRKAELDLLVGTITSKLGVPGLIIDLLYMGAMDIPPPGAGQSAPSYIDTNPVDNMYVAPPPPIIY